MYNSLTAFIRDAVLDARVWGVRFTQGIVSENFVWEAIVEVTLLTSERGYC